MAVKKFHNDCLSPILYNNNFNRFLLVLNISLLISDQPNECSLVSEPWNSMSMNVNADHWPWKLLNLQTLLIFKTFSPIISDQKWIWELNINTSQLILFIINSLLGELYLYECPSEYLTVLKEFACSKRPTIEI